ncbi:MAG: hypothetical protein CMO81_11860 [Waddliaceae bacterium]|nr:hypothetical protein [Waddliaceae bacterium]
MPNDNSQRQYPLPHPENIAVTDVSRIRESIIKIDVDVSTQESEHNELKTQVERMRFEQYIGLWSTP